MIILNSLKRYRQLCSFLVSKLYIRLMHYTCVVNPVSGDRSKKPVVDGLKDFFDSYGHTYDLFKTTGEDDRKKLSELCSQRKPDRVIIIGGDGTFCQFAQLFMEDKIPIALFPAGSANGLAYDLGLPENTDAWWDVLRRDRIKSIDAYEVNGDHIGFHIGDMGLNAKIVKRFEEDSIRGMWGYMKQFFREYRSESAAKFSLELDGETYQSKALMVAIANGRTYGTGATITEEGDLSDGELEVCIIKPFPFIAFFKILFSFFLGGLKDSDYVTIIRCKKGKIETHQKVNLQVDGEPIDEVTKCEFRVIENAVRVVV